MEAWLSPSSLVWQNQNHPSNPATRPFNSTLGGYPEPHVAFQSLCGCRFFFFFSPFWEKKKKKKGVGGNPPPPKKRFFWGGGRQTVYVICNWNHLLAQNGPGSIAIYRFREPINSCQSTTLTSVTDRSSHQMFPEAIRQQSVLSLNE